MEGFMEMDQILNYMKRTTRIIVALALLLGSVLSVQGQNFTYKWERVAMDTTWMGDGTSEVEKVIQRYQPGIEFLMEIVGYSSEELSKKNPESGLSNLAADALLFAAGPYLKPGDAAMAVTNFGGIRANLPKGAIRKYDIFSTFPFDNTIVIVDIQGKDLRKILNNFAKRERFEALSGVEIVVKDKKMVKCNVAGKPLNDNKIYKLVTIDFLLDGGDSMRIGSSAKHIERTDAFVRDGVEKYIRSKSEQGVVFDNKQDGRIVIK